MSKKFKALVYPFDMEFLSVMNFLEIFKKFEIKYLVSPEGWRDSVEELLNNYDCKDKIESYVKYEISHEMNEEYDTLYLVDSFIKMEFQQAILPVVEYAVSKGKKIIVNRLLTKREFKLIEDLCKENNVELFDYSRRLDDNYVANSFKKLSKFNVPVIFVAGTTEQTNKFSIEVQLKSYLEKLDYKVSLIGTRGESELLGGHMCPNFMFDNSMSELDKVFFFNKFVKKVEEEEEPEIIIIGIPGGTIPLDDKYRYMNSCFTSFEISRSVKPDFVVMGLPLDKYEDEYFKDVNEYIKNKYDFEIDCFHIGNILPDFNSLSDMELSYIVVPQKEVNKLMEEHYAYKKNVFSIHQDGGIEKMGESLINTLSEYSETKFF